MSEKTAPIVANVKYRNNRPTRTAELGDHPEGHAKAGKRWTRQLRSGRTFGVTQDELDRLQAWAKGQGIAADLQVTSTAPTRRQLRRKRLRERQAAAAKAAAASRRRPGPAGG